MDSLLILFITTTAQLNLPIGLLESICFVESGHDTSAVKLNDGGSNSLGVCQVKLNTARLLGFRGTAKQLQQPKTNVYYAGLYLTKNLNRYEWDVEMAIAAYNAGTCRYNSKGQIKNRRYVRRVLNVWEQRMLYAHTEH